MKNERIQYENKALLLQYDVVSGVFNRKMRKKLRANEIHSIAIERCIERRGIFSYSSERIVIRTIKKSNPVIYYGIKEYDHYDDYKNGLRIFANENDIELYDRVRL